MITGIFNTVEEFIEFLCKKEIDANEFAICMLIYKKQSNLAVKFRDTIVHPLLDKTHTKDEVMRDYLDGLVDKGMLEDFNPREKAGENVWRTYLLENYIVTPKFTNDLFLDEDDIANETWNAYPKWLMINNHRVPARNMPFDEFIDLYAGIIKNNKKLHDKIVNGLIAYEKKESYAKVGIRKFFEARQYDILDEYIDNSDEQDMIDNV